LPSKGMGKRGTNAILKGLVEDTSQRGKGASGKDAGGGGEKNAQKK